MPAAVTAATLTHLLSISTDECQPWPHGLTDRGYPQMTHASGERYAHRAALLESVGPCPDGMEAAHSCGNRACVNPRHLRWATPSDNNMDRTRHGTMPTRAGHWKSTVTEYDVGQMAALRLQGAKFQDIADMFGVHRATVSRILRGKSWVTPTT